MTDLGRIFICKIHSHTLYRRTIETKHKMMYTPFAERAMKKPLPTYNRNTVKDPEQQDKLLIINMQPIQNFVKYTSFSLHRKLYSLHCIERPFTSFRVTFFCHSECSEESFSFMIQRSIHHFVFRFNQKLKKIRFT
jgi:hypothetical protein